MIEPESHQNQNHLLNVHDLSITMDREEVLRGVSFSVEKGEALVVIGPNGAGKTMLFRALLGLIPHQGTIAWQKGVKIGYVPQKFLVDRSLPVTVREFFLLKSKKFWRPGREFLAHIEHELSIVGLHDTILRKPVSELSGGEFQRVLIAWAMLNHPDVLLCDEPTAGIDMEGEQTVHHILARLQKERGTTIVLISHDLNVVYQYATNVLCLNKKMICHGAPQQVLNPQELANIYGGGTFYHHPKNVAHKT
ncbi:MAG: metal ABC transporter ATP-binding protein [Candidatus Sungbacteria bacterium]|nr:metal ABC transporter ATP-binding protein [Candidatus Sungbacteria bacterium]